MLRQDHGRLRRRDAALAAPRRRHARRAHARVVRVALRSRATAGSAPTPSAAALPPPLAPALPPPCSPLSQLHCRRPAAVLQPPCSRSSAFEPSPLPLIPHPQLHAAVTLTRPTPRSHRAAAPARPRRRTWAAAAARRRRLAASGCSMYSASRSTRPLPSPYHPLTTPSPTPLPLPHHSLTTPSPLPHRSSRPTASSSYSSIMPTRSSPSSSTSSSSRARGASCCRRGLLSHH